jgi:hypothetical protein
LLLYVDDTVADTTPFGNVRQRAYKIMPKDTLQITGQRMSVKPVSKLALHWYLRNPQLERNVHRSQNRIESYHQLRSTIAQVGGKKELTGRTDIEIEISNQCARLIANAIIYYTFQSGGKMIDLDALLDGLELG